MIDSHVMKSSKIMLQFFIRGNDLSKKLDIGLRSEERGLCLPLPHYTCCVLRSLATIFYNQMLVSNSNISLKISTFVLRDIVGHVAVKTSILWCPIGGKL